MRRLMSLGVVAACCCDLARADVAPCIRQLDGHIYNNTIAEVVQCLIQVGGITYLNAPCTARMATKRFIAVGEGPTDKYSAHIAIDGQSVWSGAEGGRVNVPLGVLRSKGTCWENEKAKICLSGSARYLSWENVEAKCTSILMATANVAVQGSQRRFGIFPKASCKGWNGTLTDVISPDPAQAQIKGQVTQQDLEEYCTRMSPSGEVGNSDVDRARFNRCIDQEKLSLNGTTPKGSLLFASADCKNSALRSHTEKL